MDQRIIWSQTALTLILLSRFWVCGLAVLRGGTGGKDGQMVHPGRPRVRVTLVTEVQRHSKSRLGHPYLTEDDAEGPDNGRQDFSKTIIQTTDSQSPQPCACTLSQDLTDFNIDCTRTRRNFSVTAAYSDPFFHSGSLAFRTTTIRWMGILSVAAQCSRK
ncbi:hypothetical protein IW261DRAFT_205021 [Armillaria novae-zelandiae]|uniref:Uncharacterized protein n=1 Tax=Armillaria novae-zelandiae TaxID=153914 RepID=A0AA39N9M6_9AGAR|nr:hypothetical protein IW261DRAFT_205021 [Armillaria novae-zelandiae]